jgi:cell division protein FtsW
MMPALSRADTSLLGRWWWTVDRWTLLAIAALIFFGYVMMLAASPAVAERIHTARDIFILKQVVFLAAAGVLVVGVSLLSPRGVRRIALAGCALALALTFLTIVSGTEIKGARRWISLPGMSLQPSEFLKPCFAVVAAWLLSEGLRETTRIRRLAWPGLAVITVGFIGVLLKSQPDMGMLAVILGVFIIQLFVNGMNLFLVAGLFGLMGAGGFAAYLWDAHFRTRIDKFLFPKTVGGSGSDTWQVDRAQEAFGAGGLLGRGPGEGHVKDLIPDAHADFVFAVAGEEFGLIVCAVILFIFAFIVLRALVRVLHERDPFVVLAATGLAAGFGLQAFVNMASTLHMMPTKGMTLPFISYGGSSAIAVALGVGMLLALTRRRQNGDLL